MTYSRRCGIAIDDCAYSAYSACSCAMGAQPPCPPRPMTCERAQEIRARLTAHAPTAAESAEFWADEPAAYDLERFIWHPESANGSKTSTDTPAASSAGRSPHSKPRVVPIIPGFGHHVEWFVMTDCCPIAPGEEPPEDYSVWDWHFNEQSEAMDAALDHVAEVHTPQPCGRRDGTSDADLEAAWHFHNLQQWHNRQEQAS